MKIKKENICLFSLLISILIAILSNITTLSNILSPINYALWIITLLLYISTKKNDTKINKNGYMYILIIGLLLVYNYILYSLYIYDNLSGFLKVFVLPIIPYIIGSNTSDEKINKITKVYIIASLIFALWININYFRSISSWANSYMYLYNAKNSAAQIFGTTIIILLSNLKNKKYIRIVLSLYLIIIICLLKCRAAILSLMFVLIAYIYIKSKHKIKFSIIIIIISLFLSINPTTNSFIKHTLVLDKYSNVSIDEISSGRVGKWNDTIELIKNNPLLGVGKYYVDDFYLNTLAKYGIFVGLIIIIFLLNRFKQNLFNNNYNEEYEKILYYLTIYYIITSIFEGYPPFGPGTCSIMFWMLSGIHDSNRKEDLNEIKCNNANIK